MFACTGYAAPSANEPLAPFGFERREPGATDVRIAIEYCGVCHSDVHTARDEWGGTTYPVVPGHEIVGTVSAAGADVSGFKVGDKVGVGCMVGSCRTTQASVCPACADNMEQFCEVGTVFTYNSPDAQTGGMTYGGYSKEVVVDQRFLLRLPDTDNLAAVAPLLCAGITTYSPLKHWKVGPGQKVGVVGLGGLGHMALKIAHAMGAKVTLFTTSPGKEKDALRLGADRVVVSRDEQAMGDEAGSFDFIIDTVSAQHDISAYIVLLKRDRTMVQVGVPEKPLALSPVSLIFGRRSLAGSLIGGIAETQEMLDFCAEHGITADVEVIRMEEINTAYERMLKSDVKYRFVINMTTLN